MNSMYNTKNALHNNSLLLHDDLYNVELIIYPDIIKIHTLQVTI